MSSYLSTLADAPPDRLNWPACELVEVLWDFDGPRAFVSRDSDGRLFLAFQRDESESSRLYLVVPVDGATVEKLKAGEIDSRTALSSPSGWLVRLGHDDELQQCEKIEREEIRHTWTPRPGVGLFSAAPIHPDDATTAALDAGRNVSTRAVRPPNPGLQ
jgi:hypothetical protein